MERLNIVEKLKCHFTFSQKRLLEEHIHDICLKQGLSLESFLLNKDLQRFGQDPSDPVQKGKKIFQWIRNMRFPLSNGKPELPEISPSGTSVPHSKGVASLDSRKKLINPYFYGAGVFDLKEHVLSLIRSCPLDCAYCFLREVYDDPRTKIPPDFSKIELEMAQLAAQENGRIYLNAGENADSMILDSEFGLVHQLWQIVEPYKNVALEFRTKTNKIEGVLPIRNATDRLILAFSMAPIEDRAVFESNTASIEARIRAMQDLQEKGFLLGLRFEPILYTQNYEQKYRRLFSDIFSVISPRHIHSVALGCLRLTKGLAKMLRQTHAHVLAEEWVLGADKKMRYCKEIRTRVYKDLILMLRNYFPYEERIVLSTEPVSVWNAAGLPLKTMPELCRYIQPTKGFGLTVSDLMQ